MRGAGDTIGRFLIERTLGEGGNAVVYQVRHRQLDTRHALKLLTSPNRRTSERLLQEGRIQARIRHPNIVAVTDLVEVDGQVGLVMEFVEGFTLADALADGAMPLDDALDLFSQILSGVGTAHQAGILHRDLKPANVLLTVVDDQVLAKVADFGIAKVRNPSSHTMVGSTMGTPGYMAPEQISDSAGVTRAADLFALGVLLYEMLAGTKAFRGADIREIMNATAEGACVPLDTVDPSVPTRIVQAIERAMQTRPADRWESCEAFAGALGVPYRAGRPLTDALRPLPPPPVRASSPTLSPDMTLDPAPSPTVVPAPTAAETFAMGPPITQDPPGSVGTEDTLDPRSDLRRFGLNEPGVVIDPPTAPPRTSLPPRTPLPPRATAPTQPNTPPEDVSDERSAAERFGLDDPRVSLEGGPPSEPVPSTAQAREERLKRPDQGPRKGNLGDSLARVLWPALKVLAQTAKWGLPLVIAVTGVGWWGGAKGARELKQSKEAHERSLTQLQASMADQEAIAAQVAALTGDTTRIDAYLSRAQQAEGLHSQVAASQQLSEVLNEELRMMGAAASPEQRAVEREAQLKLQELDHAHESYRTTRSAWEQTASTPQGGLALKIGWASGPPAEE